MDGVYERVPTANMEDDKPIVSVAEIPESESEARMSPMSSISATSQPSRMSVAVVNHNTREYLTACLATLAWETDDVVVVDNASNDGSKEMVRARYPNVRIKVNEHNGGYGAGANEAVARCNSEYVLLLNSDTRVKPGAVAALTRYLDEHPKVAIAGPRLINADGSLQPSCYPFPTPLNVFLRSTRLGTLIGRTPFLREIYLPTSSHEVARRVGWVVGAALAVRRSAFQAVGGFDESFFMYSEEVDLCYRLQRHGWEVHFAPVATVVHEGGASTARYRADMAAQFFLSRLKFYRRHYPPVHLAQLRVIVTYFMLRNIARDNLRLLRTREPAARKTVREDLDVWRRVLGIMWSG